MSCYNWERGTIIIPKRQWPAFRKAMMVKWNELQDKRLARANKVHAQAVVVGKGGTPLERIQRLVAFTYDKNVDDVMRIICPDLFAQYPSPKLRKPTKKALDYRPISRGGDINPDQDWRVIFNDEKHSVTWDVYENNRAVERSHEHPFVKALFNALKRIEYKPGTGGIIEGNDEYNRETHGCHYVNHRFGKDYGAQAHNPATTRSRYSADWF